MSKIESIGGKFAGVEKYKKKNGVVSYYIKFKDLTNKTQREKVGDSPDMTPTKALNLLRKKQTELNEMREHARESGSTDIYIPKKKKRSSSILTLHDIASIYLRDKAETKDFANIKSKYHTHIKEHKLANTPITLITNDDIKEFIFDKKNTYVVRNGMKRKRDKKTGEWIETEKEHQARQYTLTDSTVNAIYGLIITMTNYAIEEEYYTGKNPFIKKHRPKSNNITLKFLNDEETRLFLRQLKWQSESFEVMDRYVYLIGLLAVSTGARMRTILGIRVGDIDFHNNIIMLENKKIDDQEYVAAIATVEIKELLKKFSQGKKPDDSLFVSNRTGVQIYRYPRVMNKILDLTVNIHRQKKNRMALRDLRNSLASNLALKGVPLSHIGKVLNHKSIQSTQRYAQLMPDVASTAIKEYANNIKFDE